MEPEATHGSVLQPPRKKPARSSQAVVGTSAQADEGPWQGRQRRGRFNLYCSSSHGNQLSCAQFQLFLTPLKERRGLLRAGRDRPAAMGAEPPSPGDQRPGPGRWLRAGGAGAGGAEGTGGIGPRKGWALSAVLAGAGASAPAQPWCSSVPTRDGMASRGAAPGTSCSSTKPSARAALASRQPLISVWAGR